jgi:hemerythrin-like domain-containing protein
VSASAIVRSGAGAGAGAGQGAGAPCQECDRNRRELDEAVDFIHDLQDQLRAAKAARGRRRSSTAGGGGGGDDDHVADLEMEVQNLRDEKSQLQDVLERYKESEASAKEQVIALQREVQNAQAARADAEDAVKRQQVDIAKYERDLAR